MSKRRPSGDPVGTVRLGDNHGVWAYAIRWKEGPTMGWRIIDMTGEHWLGCDTYVNKWPAVYRPAPGDGKVGGAP